MNRQDVQDKIDQYRTFLDTTLRPQLKRAKAEQDAVIQEQEAYRSLQDEIKRLDDNNSNNNNSTDNNRKMTMTVDLGWNKAYCEAQVEQSSNNDNINTRAPPLLLIAVDVGMGFHVEMTAQQATAFCQARLQLLQSKYNYRHAALHKIQQHVDTAMDILDHLANEALSM